MLPETKLKALFGWIKLLIGYYTFGLGFFSNKLCYPNLLNTSLALIYLGFVGLFAEEDEVLWVDELEDFLYPQAYYIFFIISNIYLFKESGMEGAFIKFINTKHYPFVREPF